MKITKKILENIIKEEIEKLVQEQRPVRYDADDAGTQPQIDRALYRMRKQRGDGGMDPEEANPVRRSHRVSGDIGAPTQERAHIMQALKGVNAALATTQKSGDAGAYLDDLEVVQAFLDEIHKHLDPTKTDSPYQSPYIAKPAIW